MALIKCPECGKEISDQAVACPNCGYKNNKSLNKVMNIIKIIVNIAVFIMTVFILEIVITSQGGITQNRVQFFSILFLLLPCFTGFLGIKSKIMGIISGILYLVSGIINLGFSLYAVGFLYIAIFIMVAGIFTLISSISLKRGKQ